MLTKITIRNFKSFEEAEIPLDNGVVFIGPNNSGKTSALQALSLWYAGLMKWAHKRARGKGAEIPTRRPGVTVSRLELISLPVSEIDLIWRNRKVRGQPRQNIRIELIVEGFSDGADWKCGLEFDYSNPEGLFCRPLSIARNERMEIPPQALRTRLAFLPSMSGLASEEAMIQEGRINVLIGQGQTAEVLRNLCYRVYQRSPEQDWACLVSKIEELFGVTLNPPEYDANRGTIAMGYQKADSRIKFDLPSSGRGMQQVLLLLAYLYDNDPGTVLLLDEPDAHLEILRQGEIYPLLLEAAESRQAQVIAASHSEVLLGKAARNDMAVAFVGKPHKLTAGKTSEVLKSLNEIGFDYYCNAEIKGWILYLEGESDLSILREFAKLLEHPALEHLQAPLVMYLGNDRPKGGRRHFYGLREAWEDLVGILLTDRLDQGGTNDGQRSEEGGLKEIMWRQREIENYLCNRAALLSFAGEGLPDDLLGRHEKEERMEIMEEEILDLEKALSTLGKPAPFSRDIKASDDFLEPLFRNFQQRAVPPLAPESPPGMRKKDFHRLIRHIPRGKIDREVTEKLDAIARVARSAKPYSA